MSRRAVVNLTPPGACEVCASLRCGGTCVTARHVTSALFSARGLVSSLRRDICVAFRHRPTGVEQFAGAFKFRVRAGVGCEIG